MDAGINPNALNIVSRTASQMAAFVGNHSCVETIINYVPKKELKCYTFDVVDKENTCATINSNNNSINTNHNKGLIPSSLLNVLYRFVTEVNLHPVRIVLNLQNLSLLTYLNELREILTTMCNKEMHKNDDCNELLAFKFHYLSWIIGDVLRCKDHASVKNKTSNKTNNDDKSAVDTINSTKNTKDQLSTKLVDADVDKAKNDVSDDSNMINKDEKNKKSDFDGDENIDDKIKQQKEQEEQPNIENVKNNADEDMPKCNDNAKEVIIDDTNTCTSSTDVSTTSMKKSDNKTVETKTITETEVGSSNLTSIASDYDGNKHDYIDIYIKRLLKESKGGQLDYLDYMIRECVREFPYRESIIFKQVISQLANSSNNAFTILRTSINGHRGFSNAVYCNACGNEKPDKKCSKCKAVQYCNRECQRLHWFVHKKSCNRPVSSTVANNVTNSTKMSVTTNADAIDINELSSELAPLTTAKNKI